MGFLVSIFLIVFMEFQSSAQSATPQVPCLFVFGDSLVDSGNNNDLDTEAKVNYRPYGVDFPGRVATGRFTNGLTMADFLGQLLGFDTFVPPFATAGGNETLTGVNYASGSAGIRDETGEQLGFRYSLDRQLVNHNVTISGIAGLLGNESLAKKHVGKCLYYFVIGSNDYINNYYQPDYPTSRMYTPEQYAKILVQQYSHQLKTLYELGARKISVSGVGPLGCLPAMLARGTNGSACVDSINDAARLFNDELKLLVDDLNKNLTNAKFVYIGAMDLRPIELFAIGIRFLSKPCCIVSKKSGLCLPGLSPCLVRSLHFFYDNFHPTEIINGIAATSAYLDILKLIP